MFSIGEFSKLCMVTPKTLRHYDSIGLLRPAHISAETGYRYYEAWQFRDMFFIQKCKDYGFTLEETGMLIHAEPHVVAARFAAKYALQSGMLAIQKNLLRNMRKDMEQLEKGIDIMANLKTETKIVETNPRNIASVRDVISMKNFDTLFSKAMKIVSDNQLQCMGVPIALYHHEEFDPENADVEVGMPVANASTLTRVLPGGKCAMAVHVGSYANLGNAYTAIAQWVEENGFRIAGIPYEQYLNSPHEVAESQLMTEIYFPIEMLATSDIT